MTRRGLETDPDGLEQDSDGREQDSGGLEQDSGRLETDCDGSEPYGGGRRRTPRRTLADGSRTLVRTWRTPDGRSWTAQDETKK